MLPMLPLLGSNLEMDRIDHLTGNEINVMKHDHLANSFSAGMVSLWKVIH
jgi:hypothetical protein